MIVLVADQDMLFSVRGLLLRCASFGVRHVSFDIYPHPEHDPACLLQSHNFLRSFSNSHTHALVMFDREGCGKEDLARQELETRVEKLPAQNGWDDRAAAIVLDPELEIWVWTNSPQLEIILGWQGRQPTLRSWLINQGFSNDLLAKPNQPKEALKKALRLRDKKPSSSIFRQLAESLSLDTCTDLAFAKFRETLKRWFPLEDFS